MATEWKSQQGDGKYCLQFETDNKESYLLVEKAAQMAVDGKEADVVEVKHGYWKEDGEYQICSVCGEEHHWDEYRATYCEDCGTKMDGRGEQDDR